MSSRLQDLSLVVQCDGGKLRPTEAQNAAVRNFLLFANLPNIAIRLGVPKKRRSLKQNNYLWGVVYAAISQHTGHTTEEVHALCKEQFLPRQFVQIGKREAEVTKSTSQLTVNEMNAYTEQVTAWAGTELGIEIPSYLAI